MKAGMDSVKFVVGQSKAHRMHWVEVAGYLIMELYRKTEDICHDEDEVQNYVACYGVCDGMGFGNVYTRHTKLRGWPKSLV